MSSVLWFVLFISTVVNVVQIAWRWYSPPPYHPDIMIPAQNNVRPINSTTIQNVQPKAPIQHIDEASLASIQTKFGMFKVDFNDKENPCISVFDTPKLKKLCTSKGARCLCNPTKIHRTSEFAAFMCGEVRTLQIGYPSFKHYIIDANEQLDLVVVLQNFNEADRRVLKPLFRDAVAIITHNSKLWKPMVSYATERKRVVRKEFRDLDHIQENHQKGGIIDMWANFEISYSVLSQVRKIGNKDYKLIMKTRPDQVYFSRYPFQMLLDSYKREKLLRPYVNFENNGAPIDSARYPEKWILARQPLFPELLPMFFPGCNQWTGVNDRVFFGPPIYMDIIFRDVDWLPNMLSVNVTLMNQLIPGAAKILRPSVEYYTNHPVKPVMGTEGLLLAWLLYNNIPVAEIPTKGPLKLLHGKLSPPDIGAYCKGTWLSAVDWQDPICVLSAEPVGPRNDHDWWVQNSLRNLGKEVQNLCSLYI